MATEFQLLRVDFVRNIIQYRKANENKFYTTFAVLCRQIGDISQRYDLECTKLLTSKLQLENVQKEKII